LLRTQKRYTQFVWSLNFPGFTGVIDTVVMENILLDAKVHVPVRLPGEDLLLFLSFSLRKNQSWSTLVSSEMHSKPHHTHMS
jgi:hypothetical protein